MRNRHNERQASEAVEDGDGKRRCAWCGDFIDPIDWCLNCQTRQAPCGTHLRLRKRADAAYCDSGCRSRYAADVNGPGLARVDSRSGWSA